MKISLLLVPISYLFGLTYRDTMYYKLIDHIPVKISIQEWARGDVEDFRVGLTTLDTDEEVSTVFLGLDHNWTNQGPPLLFETMIFGGKYDQYQIRYSTWEQAETGHNRIVESLLKGTFDPTQTY